jgi:hypothetical protein
MLFIYGFHEKVKEVIAKEPNLPVPMHIRNAPTKLMKVQLVIIDSHNSTTLTESTYRILGMELDTNTIQTTMSL